MVIPSADPIIIVIHILALVLFVLASKGVGVRYSERRGIWHFGWLSMALLMVGLLLMDFGVLR
jgi:hypothetical protein